MENLHDREFLHQHSDDDLRNRLNGTFDRNPDLGLAVVHRSGSMNNLLVIFWTDSTQAQNVTLDIGNVQLEVGAVSPEFARRDYGAELALSRRYFEQWGVG